MLLIIFHNWYFRDRKRTKCTKIVKLLSREVRIKKKTMIHYNSLSKFLLWLHIMGSYECFLRFKSLHFYWVGMYAGYLLGYARNLLAGLHGKRVSNLPCFSNRCKSYPDACTLDSLYNLLILFCFIHPGALVSALDKVLFVSSIIVYFWFFNVRRKLLVYFFFLNCIS